MTDNNKAFKQAQEELAKDKISEVKEIMKSILQKIQDEKEKKADAEENLRLLKLDLDDLREGKIDKIKERHEKSKKARTISPITDRGLTSMGLLATYSTNLNAFATNSVLTATPANNWYDYTAGTYLVSASNGTIKEFNL